MKQIASTIVVLSLVCGGISAGIWEITNAIENWHKGIYAGMHYNDAQEVAIRALVKKYGKTLAAQMKYGTPDVVNTHLDNLLIGTGQVRVFNVTGPRGVKYCVSVWGGLDDKSFVRKDCYEPPTRVHHRSVSR